MAKYWYVKIVVLLGALIGILWMMQGLRSGAYYQSPNSPVQILMGGGGEGESPPKTVPETSQH